MKVVVLGDGLLGNEIVKQTNWPFISRKKDNFDFSRIDDFTNHLNNFDVIVNCIAYTKTYENNKKDNWQLNYKSVDILIDFCNKFDIKLVHISTDYIYTGSVQNATEEDVPVHLGTWYGYTKLLGDALVQLRCRDFLICRLSHKPYPFPYTEAWIDMNTNGDYVDVISKLVVDLIDKNCSGVFNVGTELKTIYNLAVKTKKDVTMINKPSFVPNDTSMCLDKLNYNLFM